MTSTAGRDTLERRASQLSTASRKSNIIKARSRKQSLVTPNSAKTLESFPSLSPDASPGQKHAGLPSPPLKKLLNKETKEPVKNEAMVENLLKSTPSLRERSALFDDQPKVEENGVPGALHHASDETIRRLVRKAGAVVLVRQLAQDLAERDAEMTAFRRRAEEREKELKNMLREVEVSNLDIETRLHRISHPKGKHPKAIELQQPPIRKRVDREANSITRSVTGGIDEMMGEAMQDNVGALDINEDYLDTLDGTDGKATLRAKDVNMKEPDGQSVVSSMDSSGRSRGTLRGWKDYLWSGNTTSRKTSKASSIASENEEETGAMPHRQNTGTSGRRKGLNNDLFHPPGHASTTDHSLQKTDSRNSSVSVASWTMKLFAGNPTAADKQSSVRHRSNTVGDEQTKTARKGSTAFTPPPRSAKAALLRVSSMENTSRHLKKPGLVPQSSQKPLSKSGIPPVPPLPINPVQTNTATNLGPVEMDTIHPPDSKPPTLVPYQDGTHSDMLTDRFGFIYDQRRRKKEAESLIAGKSNASGNLEMINSARASTTSPEPDLVSQHPVSSPNAFPETPMSTEDVSEDKPAKKWQDYLKVATFPTELLSHSPSAKPGTNVIGEDAPSPSFKRFPTTGDVRASLPSTSSVPEPELSPVTAGKAEISKASLSASTAMSTSSSAEAEPVKLLLSQLTELHDSIQRDKTVKWNEYFRKVRAERKKEGEAAAAAEGRSKQAAMPEVMLVDGEMIGVAGLGNKGKVGRAKWKEFKQLVLSGIPVAYRAKIWAECSGASALRIPGYYDDLVSNGTDDATICSQIEMDINRTLTDNVFFRNGPGVTKLNEVLLAYSRRNPEVGYCQGMNLITGSLLLIMPTAEDTFWVLTSLIENILPRHYYDQSLLASRADQQVLRDYVAEILPKLWAHLVDLGIELEAVTFQWFLSVFTDCLSAEALFRVWDVIFCFNDGSTFLFQVALALLKLNEGQLLECDTAAKIYGYIGNEMTDHAISIDGLVQASEALKNVVQRSEVEERRFRAVEEARAKEKRNRGSVSASSAGSGASLSMQEPRPFDDVRGAAGLEKK